MGSQPPTNELYNLRWNSYFSNLINIFTDHQTHETLVDVTIGCEGQFIKAHKLVLSACSVYFQKIFQTHTSPQLLILLNDVKFGSLRLVIQFMYKGEVKVADSDMQSFLSLGKLLQVKGLCSVELQDKQKQNNIEQKNNIDIKKNTEEPTPEKAPSAGISLSKKTSKIVAKILETQRPIAPKEDPPKSPAPEKRQEEKKAPAIIAKKRKSSATTPTILKKKSVGVSSHSDDDNMKDNPVVLSNNNKSCVPSEDPKKRTVSVITSPEDISRIPRPPNAFMIFANQWRKKLAVEYPNESNKDISVRLGNMWKSLSPETKDTFYEDAKRADEEHKIKYPGYSYSPKEARHRKALANITKAAQKSDSTDEPIPSYEPEFIEIKCEDDRGDFEHSTSSNCSS